MHLLRAQVLAVVGAGRDQSVDELVAALRELADLVALFAQSAQEAQRGRWGVETHSVADPGVLGRVAAEYDRQPLLRVGFRSQPCVSGRESGESAATLPVRNVADRPLHLLLEAEGGSDDPAVELREGDLHRDVERREATTAGSPGRPRAGAGDPLDDGNVKVLHPAGRPLVGD